MKFHVAFLPPAIGAAIGAALLTACSSVPIKGSTTVPVKGSTAIPIKGSTAGYIIPEDTYSPNRRYGVVVPVFDEKTMTEGSEKNQIIELKSKRVVVDIDGDRPGYNRTLNHHDMGVASWSADSSVLLWDVDGKWCPDLIAMVKLEDGKAKWQLDLLHTAQRATLGRTRKAKPERYAAVKKENAGDGSAYPDGFTVDVVIPGGEGSPISLPLAVQVNLTANPKGIESYPYDLDSYLDGIVNEEGTFVVKSFHLGPRPGGNGRW